MEINNNLPLSIYDLNKINLFEKSLIMVTSSGSRYKDDVWNYHKEIEQRNLKDCSKRINWKIDLLNGEYLTDEPYEVLLITLKDFIYSNQIGESKRGVAPKATTIIKTHRSLIPLVRWMVSQHILDFRLLDAENVERYIAYLRVTDSRFGKPISDGEMFKRLDVINELWLCSEHISNGLLTNPYPHKNPYELSGISKEKQKENRFDFIPDHIALALGTIAVNYVENLSKNILDAYEATKVAFEETLLQNSEAEAHRRSRKAANKYGYKYVKEVSRDYGNLRTACYIVVAMFSGIRDSEVASLDVGCIQKDVLDGYIWIRGHHYKTVEKKTEARWMVPPVVAKAVDVAERLTFRLRSEVINKIDELNKDLNAPLTSGKKLEKIESEFYSLVNIKDSLWLVRSSKLEGKISSNKTIHQQLHEFIKTHDVPTFNDKHWALHPHQFRRTFVRFMVKNSMNLKYLQEHFKHVSLDMTAWYDIEDTALTQDIISYYNELTKDVLTDIVDSKNIAGKGGAIIDQSRDDYFKGVVFKNRDKVIKAMADTVTLRSTGVSWCLGDIENGECSGVHGCMIDPSNVNKCSQAIVTQEHLPAWEDIRLLNQELLEIDDLGIDQKKSISNFLSNVVNPVIKSLTK